ncbi:hypothetical protein OIU78_023553 [Salix suchowensis]|nr:hypothetical protein OIU78_023553 [Salix suchowensis]
MFCACGVVAGIVGGLLGIGGGFVMGPLFLEMGIHPQVSSGTATFGMLFSSSMSVVEYYLLGRFPVPYALYFIAVTIVAAFIGQYIITKLIRKGIPHHLCASLHNIYQRHSPRWGWHNKHDWKD